MAGQLRLSETQLSDLRSISELTVSSLQSILGRLNELTPTPMYAEEVRGVFLDVLPDKPQLVDTLQKQVLGLAGLQYRSDVPPDVLIEALRSSLEARFKPEEIDGWKLIESVFRDILASQAIRTLVKSIELTYDYANLVQSINVITDIRPVFDDAADHVIGAVVSFTLRLTYENGSNVQSLSLAIDAEDVEKLRDQCDRALKKAETGRHHFADTKGTTTRIEISGKSGR